MAKIVSEKQVNSFVKGLITEANPLTFPENSSIDEDNFDLLTNGSRKRRLGIDYEVGYQFNPTGLTDTLLSTTYTSAHNWYFPGGATNIVLGVIRVHNVLYFVNLLEANPSAHLMNRGNSITLTGLGTSDIQTTVINNYFIIVSKELDNPVILSYDASTDTVTNSYIPIFIRDLDGVDDGLAYDARPTTLSNQHKYNLINQGWNSKIYSTCSTPASVVTEQVIQTYKGGYRDGQPIYDGDGNPLYETITRNIPAVTVGAIDCTFSSIGAYPSNADQWSLGKIGDATSASFEKYDPAAMKKNSLDNTLVSKGSFILDAFNRGANRITLSGVSGLLEDKETGKITTVASYAGRAFYSGIISNVRGKDRFSPNYSGYIFFSQIAPTKEKMGLCYQENDPTSPTISDILDTDGGTIHIPEANKIIKLIANRNSLVVFAENGIWEVFGDTGGFLATSYQVSKVSSIGISNPSSIVDAGGNILYWAKTGVHMITQDPTSGRLITQNISISTVQTFYDGLPDISKLNARGFYDESKNTVRWLYNDNEDYAETNYINTYTKQLNLSLSLQAFYKYSFSSLNTTAAMLPRICDFIQIPGYSLVNVDLAVAAGDDLIVTTNLDQVITTARNSSSRSGTYNYLTFKDGSFTISKLSNTSFYDWKTEDGVGVDSPSYLITGYEYIGDIMKEKQVPYIMFYLNRTEDGFTVVGDTLVADNQSSCLVQAQWNWANSINSGKWGTQFQAYRILRNYIPSGAGDNFDYGDSIVVTKNKLRGSGKVLSLKISSEPGKDLQLLGWGMVVTGKSEI